MRKGVINLLFCAALSVLAVLAFIASREIKAVVDTDNWIMHTQVVIEKTDEVLLPLLDAESNLRGYIISGDLTYLKTFQNSVDHLTNSADAIKKLTRDNASQQVRIEELQDLIVERIAIFQTAIKVFNRKDKEAFSAFIAAGEGRIVTNKIKKLLTDIKREESRLLQQRTELAKTHSYQSSLIVIGGNVISMILFLLVFLLLTNSLKARQRAERQAAEFQNRLQAIMEGSADLIAAIDNNNCYITFNTAYAREIKKLFGKQIRINMSIRDVFDANNPAHAVSLHTWQRALAGEEFSIMREFKVSATEYNYYELTCSSIKDNQSQLIGAAQVIRNVTKRVQEEKVLQMANDKLEQGFTELTQYNSEIILLSEMSRALQTCLTVQEVFKPISLYCQQILAFTAGILYIMHPSRNYMEAVTSWSEPVSKEQLFVPDQCWALRSEQMHHADKTQGNLVCAHVKIDKAEALPLHICIPLMAQNDTLGLLYLELLPSCTLNQTAITPLHSRQLLMETIAEQIGLALANIRLRETLRLQSIRDPLTNLFNRRYLEESLLREVQRAERKKMALAVIMLDVDHFKRFNGTHGHDAGDVVLRELGHTLQAHTRESDIACRFGGEEFTWILAETTLEVAVQRAEELRKAVRQIQMKFGHEQLGVITISQGLALFPQDGMTGEALITAADTALYQAKKAERDCVIVHQNIPST